mgnify:CR=1 FL=1
MAKLAAQYIYELLDQTKRKLKREKKINLFRTTQEYTRQIIHHLPKEMQDRIFSDSILTSLVTAPFFYGHELKKDESDFSPDTAYGIGHKYISRINYIHQFIIGESDQWFEYVRPPWKLDVEIYIERCKDKQRAWFKKIPDDVYGIICSFL